MAGKIIASQRIGSLTIEIEGETPQDIFKGMSLWSELPEVCGECGSPVVLTFRSPKGNNYYHLRCTGVPAHEAQVRQHKEGGGLYFKADEKFQALYQGQARDDEEPSGNTGPSSFGPPAQPSFGNPAPANNNGMITEKQKETVGKIRVAKGFSEGQVDDWCRKNFGKPVTDLSNEQGATLIKALQEAQR